MPSLDISVPVMVMPVAFYDFFLFELLRIGEEQTAAEGAIEESEDS